MNIAFYAPLKSPDHLIPSGDRLMARLLIKALKMQQHHVEIASSFRSFEDKGSLIYQQRKFKEAKKICDNLIQIFLKRPLKKRPHIWFTYHLYYKAPDLIGPFVSHHLNIPYIVAEASHARKRLKGPWAFNAKKVIESLNQADHILTLNPRDNFGLVDLLRNDHKITNLAPFLETQIFQKKLNQLIKLKKLLAKKLNCNPTQPWLLTVAMMRFGDKLSSYNFLAEALVKIKSIPWQLIIVGDGPARQEIEKSFESLSKDQKVFFVGQQDSNSLINFYRMTDIFVWPAINEAYGMSLLEAQTSGLPVVAGDYGGVSSIVYHNETGLLNKPGDIKNFTKNIKKLLSNPELKRTMSKKAKTMTKKFHSLSFASKKIDTLLHQIVSLHEKEN
ncbi:MAG: glycosyltransferase family 4 protein [Alphaproteobacteria bacterium]|nr:glycosyltransferase family 4 protein [Alphaproteobacteria bacterium]